MNNRPTPQIPSACSSGWAFSLLLPPGSPLPWPHPAQALLSGGPRLPWARRAEQINKPGTGSRQVQALAPQSPWLGSQGGVGGAGQAFVWVFKSRGHWVSLLSQAGREEVAPTQARVWRVTGKSPEESYHLAKTARGKGWGATSGLDRLAGPPCQPRWGGEWGPRVGHCWPFHKAADQ